MNRLFTFLFSTVFAIHLNAQTKEAQWLLSINSKESNFKDQLFKPISATTSYVTAVAWLTHAGIAFGTKNKPLQRKSITIFAGIATAAAVTTTLKYSINRTRPYETYPQIIKKTSGGSPSFPSGHTSDAFATATAFSLAHPKWYVIAPAYLWASSVGYSRMYLGVHYPSDVLVGALVGAGSAYLCHVINKKIHTIKSPAW